MNLLELRGGLVTLSTGLLVVDGGSVTTYSTTATINYAIDGIIRQKTAITNGATPTTDGVTGTTFPLLIGGGSVANVPGKGAIFIWGLNAAGTVKVVMSRIFNLDMQGNVAIGGAGYPVEWPPIPDDFCPFAYQVLKAGATASSSGWTFGSSNWNATGITSSIKNVVYLPTRPQVS